jgi:hypothetical protein
MPFFLLQAITTNDSWVRRLARTPENILEHSSDNGLFLPAGAKSHGYWQSFGEYDFVAIIEAPTNADMAVVWDTLYGGWGGKAFKTIMITPLLTLEESAASTIEAQKVLAQSSDSKDFQSWLKKQQETGA